MSSVRRVYVEKKEAFAGAARDLTGEIRKYLGISSLTRIRILIRYDIEEISDAVFEQALNVVFSEPPVDTLYRETFPMQESDRTFTVEYLPGQFDQRADSAVQCVQLIREDEQPIIRSATTYVLEGEMTDEQFAAVKNYCINPVDSREAAAEKPETLRMEFADPEDVKIFDGLTAASEDELKELYASLNLAMTFRDFLCIRDYFRDEEKRDPSMTEVRMLDTYWSDHCRHTTFLTELKNVSFDDGKYAQPIQETWHEYLADRDVLYKGRSDKFVSLMDMALLGAKKLKAEGKLEDQEESDEINACSIVVPIEIDGETEEWLINFKNETHNHPTEIEPFGGAATCLGGAIRDPLSGRTYVYQAMRVTGAADPRASVAETMPGKLPQVKLVREAAHGYSSYGNQIGLATGYVKEVYHPDYVAKRMEIGAVMAAAPRNAVMRETSDPGNIIILLGGRTGRDGIGGATGSSKAHTTSSIEVCGAEVQKGNAPTERKLQRMFRRPEVSSLIRKCNDFGAGGVSVAIGELADGLRIDLDKVPKKYAGLDGTELAISESQERMAVVVAAEDVEKFLGYAQEENLEAVCVAEVTEEPRLVLTWRGKEIVNVSRAFLNTNGAHQETDVQVEMPSEEENYFNRPEVSEEEAGQKLLDTLADLNCCSQRGLVERFDGSIGAGSVLMPFGGKYQRTETQAMVAKVPVLKGHTDAVTMMSYGFDPYLSSWSPYHGSQFAIVESVARIAAAGGDVRKIRFTFQEYFRRMSADPKRWSQPMAALLGAYRAQVKLGLPSIGGKDSMSGSFNEIDVPPTLVSFAVDVASERTVVTPELKKAGSRLVWLHTDRDSFDLPDYDKLLAQYDAFFADVKAGRILSAWAVDGNGMAAGAARMAFGNRLGVKFADDVTGAQLFAPNFGDILAEVPADAEGFEAAYTVVGEVVAEESIRWRSVNVALDQAQNAWEGTLENVFRTRSAHPETSQEAQTEPYKAGSLYVCKNKVAKPRVFIPVFPGTNCEYDSARVFEAAGAETQTVVFRNMTASDVRESVETFTKAIEQAQIIMFPGGFSAGDEPDGSAKFFATAFRNEKIKEAVNKLLQERDGLALGICNGFQALIKLGLVPNGEILTQTADSPTLTFNTIGRHISRMVYTKVMSNKSPWLQGATLGETYVNPASHGEGRFVANAEWLKKLAENGQIATMYADANGQLSMDEEWNINGSFGGVEGITSPDGRVFGKMCHSERRGQSIGMNIVGNQDMKIFESGVAYFK
ncbi:MAG: phosphoribosylformylglycinamidine synthase [Lachnospiraceae bacterium]|nr:phosphoribosylformylglycinamidine synthase [Lachnospiraceae bacterium]